MHLTLCIWFTRDSGRVQRGQGDRAALGPFPPLFVYVCVCGGVYLCTCVWLCVVCIWYEVYVGSVYLYVVFVVCV